MHRIGLIGPNGAGESTLLAILAEQVEPIPQDSLFEPGLIIRQVLEREMTLAHTPENEREGRIREIAGRSL